jgi:hypothetical protein
MERKVGVVVKCNLCEELLQNIVLVLEHVIVPGSSLARNNNAMSK